MISWNQVDSFMHSAQCCSHYGARRKERLCFRRLNNAHFVNKYNGGPSAVKQNAGVIAVVINMFGLVCFSPRNTQPVTRSALQRMVSSIVVSSSGNSHSIMASPQRGFHSLRYILFSITLNINVRISWTDRLASGCDSRFWI